MVTMFGCLQRPSGLNSFLMDLVSVQHLLMPQTTVKRHHQINGLIVAISRKLLILQNNYTRHMNFPSNKLVFICIRRSMHEYWQYFYELHALLIAPLNSMLLLSLHRYFILTCTHEQFDDVTLRMQFRACN